MKKILRLISLVIVSFLLASCAPKNTISNPDLYGVWQVKEIKDVEEKQKIGRQKNIREAQNRT